MDRIRGPETGGARANPKRSLLWRAGVLGALASAFSGPMAPKSEARQVTIEESERSDQGKWDRMMRKRIDAYRMGHERALDGAMFKPWRDAIAMERSDAMQEAEKEFRRFEPVLDAFAARFQSFTMQLDAAIAIVKAMPGHEIQSPAFTGDDVLRKERAITILKELGMMFGFLDSISTIDVQDGAQNKILDPTVIGADANARARIRRYNELLEELLGFSDAIRDAALFERLYDELKHEGKPAPDTGETTHL